MFSPVPSIGRKSGRQVVRQAGRERESQYIIGPVIIGIEISKTITFYHIATYIET